MLSLALSLAATPPLGRLDTASAVVVAMVAGAVALVFWASRPSVIARYSARPPAEGADAESAEKEPRA